MTSASVGHRAWRVHSWRRGWAGVIKPVLRHRELTSAPILREEDPKHATGCDRS